jgi:type IV/VI secretion system ImpK/VasF family protein
VSAALWQAILATLDGITALVDATLPPAGGDAGPGALASLSTEIGARMDALGVTLAAAPNAQAMTQTLVLYLDEHVMAELTVPDRLSWPLLQERALPTEDGGDVFYDRLDKLLRPPAAPSMLLEVYAYCLDAGFRGRYDDSDDRDKARIAQYRRDIAAVLAPVAATSAPPGAAGAGSPKLPASGRPAAVYYAVTALIVVAICVAPMLLSNL